MLGISSHLSALLKPVIADEKLIRWGKEPSRSFCDVLFFVCFPRFCVVSRFCSYENEYLLLYVFGFPFCIHKKTRSFHLFPFLSFFFLSFFRFSLRVSSRTVVLIDAPQPTAIIQQHHNNSSTKRARVCLCERGKFVTHALFSVQVMALGSTNREVIITAGEVLFLETKLAASSALLVIWPPRNQTKKLSFFEPAFLLLNTTKAQTKLRKPQYLRTASTAEQPSIDPAQSSKVHTQYIQCVCRPECDNASKQA